MKNHLILAAVWAAFALPAAAQDVTPDTVVATVNGEDITMTHVLDIHRQLPDQYRNIPAETLYQGIVDQLIQQRAMAASVEEPAWIDEALENQRAALLAGIVMGEADLNVVSEENIAAAYDAQFGDFEGEREFNASHILVETEEEAASLIEQIDAGGDFAALAQEFSTGPSGPRGGELGWFGEGMMVPEFEAAVLALEVGGVSPPVQTQFGWHVVKLNDARSQPAPSLDEVRADIEGQLRSEALQARMDELLDVADVNRVEGIDPEALNTLDVFGQ
ncbi:MAG: peptidylprolyl isomerase [Pseudomonadota bacterium]